MRSVVKDLRLWLLRGLLAVLGLTFVVIVAGVVWGLLSLLGDESGAAVARGITLSGGVLWASVLAVLVILLALDRAFTAEAAAPPEAHHTPLSREASSEHDSADVRPQDR